MPTPYPIDESDLSNRTKALCNAFAGDTPAGVPYPVDEADLSNQSKAIINALSGVLPGQE
jgi:hypothetical protein